MTMKRKFLLASTFAAIIATVTLLTLVPASRPRSDCWDCSLSFEHALAVLGAILSSLTVGTWLRGCGRSLCRGIGNFFLCVTCLYIWIIHHAGREWGIYRFGNSFNCYDPNTVSVFVLLLIIVCSGFVAYFGKRASSTRARGASGDA
jgi:hypothetical protein